MTDVVHVITDLGPTEGPGLVVPAELLGPALHAGGQRIPLWYYDPLSDSLAHAAKVYADQVDQMAEETLRRHR